MIEVLATIEERKVRKFLRPGDTVNFKGSGGFKRVFLPLWSQAKTPLFFNVLLLFLIRMKGKLLRPLLSEK